MFTINFEIWDPFNSDGIFSISKLIGFFYISTLLPYLGFFCKINKIKAFIVPLWLMFFLITIVGFLNINSLSSSFFNFSIFQNIILFWILINHERRNPNILLNALLFYSFGSILLSLFYFFDIGTNYIDGRLIIFGDNPNSIGMKISISIAILCYYIISLKKNNYIFAVCLIPFIPLMIKLVAESGSRVSFISLIMMTIIGVILLKTKKRITKVFSLIVGGFITLFVITFMLNSEIIVNRLNRTIENKDLATRDIIWQKILPLIESNPLFGVGITGYEEYSIQVFNIYKSPHNVLIELLCYGGIFSLLLYLFFISKTFILATNQYKKNGNFIVLILFIPIIGYLLSGQILTNKIIWTILSYIVSSSIFFKHEKYL